MAQLKTIQSLQAGRGLAALVVVFHHANSLGHAFSRDHGNSILLQNGYLGVDFFFVLSGFIIYHSTVGHGRTAAEYALARFRRVYLPYWPIGIGIALLYLAMPTLSAGDRVWSWVPTLTLLPVSSLPALPVAWTLKHEILFYAMFGLCFFTGRLVLGLSLWGIAIVAANLLGFGNNVPLNLLNLEFFMGMAIAILYRKGFGHWWLMLFAPFPAALWIYLGSSSANSVLVGLALALVILPVARLEAEGHLTIPRALTFLGAASYSIYLAHVVCVSAASRLVRGDSYWVITLVAAAVGIAGGLAYYFLVERRILRVAPGDRRHERLTGEEPPERSPSQPEEASPQSSAHHPKGRRA